jgi:hypothetical protein
VGVLRPGVAVTVLELSVRGALIESPAPVRPGASVELALESPKGRRDVARGRVVRCWVMALTPIKYRAALGFDMPLRAG